MTIRALPLLAVLLFGVLLGYAASGWFQAPTPVEPVVEAWDGTTAPLVELAGMSLAEIRVREFALGEDAPGARVAENRTRGAAPLSLPQVMEALRSLDDAPPGEATNRRERNLVERWAELDPAAAATYAD